ncbi:TIGR04283 family arsenosugar biosynthesis glycosyltransferase [Halopseudomonas phragmitis]|uniref:TIGR04283 family arsenosugar biosynthesis glycosyltransferase n=1 Tax=Halopseudomonas phragmitis TaxID=1931241 RepID=UPI0015A75732|nr:TIGR04283 family arsenosugar biosynthesis glycosyltransferase [Halopseudomonas phragmitis]
MRLSVILPVRDEAAGIVQALLPLQELRGELEIIVVDGNSNDATRVLAEPLADQVIVTETGRARQMNAGALLARGEWLLFLHADTRLPEGFMQLLPLDAEANTTNHTWGRFDVRLQPSSPLLRLVAWMMNRRSRLTGVCTGDQAIFVHRTLFEQLGGYAEIPLMEDIELSKRLRRRSPPLCISTPLTTSSRRWQQHGTLPTILLMWRLRLLYWLGVAPERLAQLYRQPSRHNDL